MGRLQKAASRIAGKPVHIRIDSTNEPAEAVGSTTPAPEPQKAISAEDDAYVQEAVAIFRATVVRTDRL